MKKDDSENEDETAIWTSLVGNLFGAIMKMYIYQQSNGCDENCPNKRSPKGTYDPEYLDRALNILKEISKKLEGHKYTCDEKMQENLSDQILENTDITFEETVLRDGQATSTFMSATTTSSSKSNFFNVEPMSDPMIAELETESPNISPRTDQSCQTFAVTKPRMEYLLDKEDRTNVFTTKSALTNNDEPSPCSSDDSKRSKKKKGKRQCSRPKKTSSRNSSKITFNEVEFDDNIIDYESFPKNNITFFSNDYANNDNIKEIIRCLGCGRPLSPNESGICGDCKAILAQNALRPKCCSCGNTYTYDTLYGALCKKCLSVLSSYDHPKNNPPPKKPPKIDFINIDKRLYVVPAENNEYAEEIFEDVTICPPNNTIPGSPVNNNLRRESVSSHSCNCSEYEEESESEICIPCTKETSKDVNYKDYPKYNKFNRNYEARHFLISTPQINLHDKPNFPNQCNYNSKILNNQQITSKQLEFQDALNKITEIFNGPDFGKEVFSNKLSRGSIQTIRTFEKEFVFPDHLKVFAVLLAIAYAQGGGEDKHHGFAINHEHKHGGGDKGHFGKEEKHGHSTSYANIERHDGKDKEVHFKAHPEYHYGFKIDDDTHHVYTNKEEERDGYKVKGKYSLVEPDGKTVRLVEYTADKKEGFNAKVSYKHHH